VDGRGSRNKGAKWERLVALWLSSVWPAAHRTRTPGYQSDRGDIGGTPYVIECKDVGKIDLGGFWRQTLEAAERCHGTPVLIIKRKGHPDPDDAYVVMDGRTWLEGQT
jgi:hypothetical protein